MCDPTNSDKSNDKENQARSYNKANRTAAIREAINRVSTAGTIEMPDKNISDK